VPRRRVEAHHPDSFTSLEAARRYAGQAGKSTIRYRDFLNKLKKLDLGGRYLEVGPGPGILAAMIAAQVPGVQITGLEQSPDMAEVGREYVAGKGLGDRIRFVVGDAMDADLIASLGTFDLVYSTYSLHEWDDPRRVIAGLLPAIADGGALFLHDLRRVWWLYWLPSRSGFFTSIRAAYTPGEVRVMFREAGLSRHEVKPILFMLAAIAWK
jgi:SAM-dependent methyltransferase